MVEAEVSSNSSSQTLRLRPELAPLPLSSCLSKRLVTNDVAVRNLKIEGLKTPPSRGPFLMAVGFALDFHLLVNPMPSSGLDVSPVFAFAITSVIAASGAERCKHSEFTCGSSEAQLSFESAAWPLPGLALRESSASYMMLLSLPNRKNSAVIGFCSDEIRRVISIDYAD
jgi:hypothetical protein